MTTTKSMATVPKDPMIFHITHVENLSGILAEGGLWSDAQRIARRLVSTNIGLLHIKQRRLDRDVETHAGGKLGNYVPFNFCPRSVMLYSVSRGHDDYRCGQMEIVYLVSRVSIATGLGRPWAFTDRHAELAHALHFDNLEDLDEVPWSVMKTQYWTAVREERQAEFLVYEFFPWSAVAEIAVMDDQMKTRVEQRISVVDHRPTVTVRREWYY